jgi:hypothetical protein
LHLINTVQASQRDCCFRTDGRWSDWSGGNRMGLLQLARIVLSFGVALPEVIGVVASFLRCVCCRIRRVRNRHRCCDRTHHHRRSATRQQMNQSGSRRILLRESPNSPRNAAAPSMPPTRQTAPTASARVTSCGVDVACHGTHPRTTLPQRLYGTGSSVHLPEAPA